MFGAIARKLFGTANERYIKGLQKDVDAINALEADVEPLSDDELRARTDWLRKRIADGETLDDVLVDAFATVREAAKRSLGQRHYDVQLLGGIVLHRGQIAEMATGEGKTLVATLAAYLNALDGKGVHVVTVNDYLAKRDSDWMGKVFTFLGMTTSCILNEMDDVQRQEAYACDITYATNNELGFDYLRDNMKFSLETMVQRPFNFAVVDEVDSILIDEARTPLIISGPSDDSSELYGVVDSIIPHLSEDDYERDEKVKSVALSEKGMETAEVLLRDAGLLESGGLYDLSNVSLLHHVNSALRAHHIFTNGVDYLVKDGKVMIVDEFTGRVMEGRRYSDGLHQALEAKEKVAVQQENQTLASVTFQNYFRLYPKLSGMTGTAMTEAGEFAEIYKLEVVDMPTNRILARKDYDDEVYRSRGEKINAILEQIIECHERKQPILVGTVSIEQSEEISAALKKKKVKHEVLNAKQHEREAYIVAQAGVPGAVTIATNMAGRGTDIQLGGNLDMRIKTELGENPSEDKIVKIQEEIAKDKKVALDAGGLFMLGTERHESRRIDNQLRGRSGRQGDVGASKFFLSLEDDLMRIFGSERMDSMLTKLGLEDGEAIVHPWINKALEKAQQKVEGRNFDMRKQLLKFDDVMNDQRKVIFEQRREMMSTDDVSEHIQDMRHEVIDDIVDKCIPEKAYAEQWDTDSLHEEILRVFNMDLPLKDWAKEEGVANEEIRERILDETDRKMAAKVANYGEDVWRSVEKSVLLQLLDTIWKEHLLALDHLRQGIGLRAYAQRDPLNEYKAEAFNLFEEMISILRDRVITLLAHVELQVGSADEELEAFNQHADQEMTESRQDPALAADQGDSPEYGAATVRSNKPADHIDPNDQDTWGKVSRNAPCPCGSGKKFKHCHG
ncbi:preprotein translocase subunit, ATPase [Candidatus Terasakiella magnetica]|uniref:Protein translocase subunit SecA n=1 Tax=Candidatus Terasakiella magnetica TaxID=1867952 RepID=A0A1C3RHK5_9PROT|nr:preprotein translocase subunit SecA [Candidatus Terasakiella magnetica]SCA56763.1 preprotein translocase subunit, ATPase [Candidatus Terasakiella magnetica]